MLVVLIGTLWLDLNNFGYFMVCTCLDIFVVFVGNGRMRCVLLRFYHERNQLHMTDTINDRLMIVLRDWKYHHERENYLFHITAQHDFGVQEQNVNPGNVTHDAIAFHYIVSNGCSIHDTVGSICDYYLDRVPDLNTYETNSLWSLYEHNMRLPDHSKIVLVRFASRRVRLFRKTMRMMTDRVEAVLIHRGYIHQIHDLETMDNKQLRTLYKIVSNLWKQETHSDVTGLLETAQRNRYTISLTEYDGPRTLRYTMIVSMFVDSDDGSFDLTLNDTNSQQTRRLNLHIGNTSCRDNMIVGDNFKLDLSNIVFQKDRDMFSNMTPDVMETVNLAVTTF
jgi:hypothetical protein